jgi:hypothetical protein
MQQPDANGYYDVGFGVDVAIGTAGKKKRRAKKKTFAKGVVKSYQNFSWTRAACPLSGLNANLRTLIADIYAGNASAQTYFNHGYDKDPETRGAVGGGSSVHIYYQPATGSEDTISNDGVLSGRRRLAVKITTCDYPEQTAVYAFYLTNHPEKKPGLPDNSYGIFTPVDTSR